MKKSNPLKIVYYPFLKIRAIYLANLISPYVGDSVKVLDVGAGNMFIARELVEKKNVKIIGIDVIDMNLTNLPHKVYNGSGFQFKDKNFDVCLFIGVLHHTNNQIELLNEAKRVSKRVIIFEDIYTCKLEQSWLKLRDVIGNIPEEPSMDFALNFKTDAEWKKIFAELNFEVKESKKIYNLIRLSRHALYVLDVDE